MLSDEGEYALEARLLSQGGRPYADAYSPKPPGLFFLYRAAAVLGPPPAGPRRLAVLASLATMALLAFCVPAAWGPGARLAAAAAYGSLSTLPLGDLAVAANAEVFLNLFLALSAFLLRKNWDRPKNFAASEIFGPVPGFSFWAGVAAGGAWVLKQTALWPVLALLAVSGKGWKAFLAGAVVLPGLAALWLAWQGLGGVFVEQAWTRSLDYAAVPWRTLGAPAQVSWFLTALAPGLAAACAPAALLALLGGRGGSAWAERAPRLALLWLGASLAAAASGLWLFPHYFLTAFAPLALAAAAGVAWLGRIGGARASGAAVLLLALWPALLHPRTYFLETPAEVGRRLLHPNPVQEAEAAAAWLRERAATGDRLYVFGSEPQLYVRSGLAPATPHPQVLPLTLFPKDGREGEAELERLRSRPPRWAVYVAVPSSTLVASRDGEAFRRGIQTWLEAGYALRAAIPVTGEEGGRVLDAPAGARARWGETGVLYLFEVRPPGEAGS